MIEQELAQRAISEAIEAKSEALRASKGLREGVVLELEFWGDLEKKFPDVFRRVTARDIISLLFKVVEANGHLKLENIEPLITYLPNDWSVPVVYKHGSYLTDEDILLTWRIRYSEKPNQPNVTSTKRYFFWLTAKGLIYKPSNEVAVPFRNKNVVAYRLLQFLANNVGQTSRADIAKELHTSPENVSEEIAKLRTKVSGTIGLDGEEFIVSEPGYGLGENMRIEER